jgi:exodeoxyribonuclease VII small subunit
MPSPVPGDPPSTSFEAHLAALEKVVADLEGDALSLEASIGRYQEGVGHLAACRKILDAAEQRLAELVASPDGTVTEQPLAVTAEGLVHAELKGGAVPKGDAGPSDRASRAESPPRGPSGAAALGSPAFGAGVEPAAPARPRRAAKKPAPSGEPGDDLPF